MEAECQRLAAAIGRGADLDALVERLRARQGHRDELRPLQENVLVAPVVALERRIREKLADWRGLLGRNVETGREVLKTLLLEPLQFTPVVNDRRRGYAFTGRLALDRIVSGVVELPRH